jgi:hypothetical protein
MSWKESFNTPLDKAHIELNTSLALIVLVGIFLTACAPPTMDSPIPPVAYIGRVMDDSNQHLIEGAKVTLDLQGTSRIDFTDTEGIYHFELPISSEANGTIRVDAQGYAVYTRNIVVTPNQGPIEDIRLVPQTTTSIPATQPTASIDNLTSPLPQATGALPIPVSTSIQPPSSTNTAIPTQRIIADTAIPPILSTSTATPLTPTEIVEPSCLELLSHVWRLEGTGPQEAYEDNDIADSLKGKSFVRIKYNLHGLMALPGDASAIIFDQPLDRDWHFVSLSNYGTNGLDGQQVVEIPLSAFPGLNVNQQVGTLHTRFWHESDYIVEIFSILVCV